LLSALEVGFAVDLDQCESVLVPLIDPSTSDDAKLFRAVAFADIDETRSAEQPKGSVHCSHCPWS